MRTGLLSAAMGLLAVGCGPSGFERLGTYQLDVSFASFAALFSMATFEYDASQGCESLDSSFSVKVNGSEVPVEPGGLEPWLAPTRCERPTFGIPRPHSIGERVSIDARCQGDQLLIDIEGMGLNLDGHLVLAPGEQVHVGQTIQVALDPGWDRLTWPANGSFFVEGLLGVPFSVAPSAEGILELPLPAELPAGRMNMQLFPESTLEVTRCDGPPGGCTATEPFPGLGAELHLAFDVVQ